MKVAIVGSRRFGRMAAVVDYVNRLPVTDQVISGGAIGVDRTAAETALARGMAVRVFSAQWNTHGKAAGFMRNHDIVNAADRVVAFWDGESRGTAHSIELAQAAGKPLEIIR